MDESLSLHLPTLAADRAMRRGAFGCIAAHLTLWWSRARERRALARLDARELRDIGLSRVDARREAAKPFWQP